MCCQLATVLTSPYCPLHSVTSLMSPGQVQWQCGDLHLTVCPSQQPPAPSYCGGAVNKTDQPSIP